MKQNFVCECSFGLHRRISFSVRTITIYIWKANRESTNGFICIYYMLDLFETIVNFKRYRHRKWGSLKNVDTCINEDTCL